MYKSEFLHKTIQRKFKVLEEYWIATYKIVALKRKILHPIGGTLAGLFAGQILHHLGKSKDDEKRLVRC